MKMNEHHEHTEFLKHCLRYDDSPERHALTEKIVRLQHELRVVKRASWLMSLLIAINSATLAYPAILVDNFPYNMQRFTMNLVLALFVGLSICLVAFILLGIFLYLELHRQRGACRQRLKHFFATRFDSGNKDEMRQSVN
jgi:hypothetical protein